VSPTVLLPNSWSKRHAASIRAKYPGRCIQVAYRNCLVRTGFHVSACPKALATVASEASQTSMPAEKPLLMAIGERDRFRLFRNQL
jgi:hypothetical protein